MIDFTREVDDMVFGALNPGEQVIWKGHCLSRMGQQQKANAQSRWLWLFAVPFAGAGLFILISGVAEVSFGGIFCGAIFLFIGISMGHEFYTERFRDSEMYCRKRTVYVLTDQRAMVLRNCRTAYPVQSLLWAYADEVRAERIKVDGRGTVQFLSWDPVEQRWVHSLRFFMTGNAQSVAERAIAARDAIRA